MPTSNIVSERDFAVFDVLLKTRPNATTVALEQLKLLLCGETTNLQTGLMISHKNKEESILTNSKQCQTNQTENES